MALSRAQKKFIAIERANRRLQHRLDDIDWELDDLQEKVEQIARIESTKRVEIGVGDDAASDDQD